MVGMLTHYYAAPPLLALVVYLLWRLPARDGRRIIFTVIGWAIVFGVIWGWGIWRQRAYFSANMQWILWNGPGLVPHTLVCGFSQPVEFLLETTHPNAGLAIESAVLLLLPLMAVRRRPGVLLWELILLLSIGVVATTDLIRSSRMVEYLRYTAVGSAAICAALVVFLEAFAKRWWQVLAAVILVVELYNAANFSSLTPDFRGMAQVFASKMDSGDALVIFESPRQRWASTIFYFAATHYAQRMPGEALVMTHAADEETMKRLETAKRIWIINASGVGAETMVPGIEVEQTKGFPPLCLVQEGELRGH